MAIHWEITVAKCSSGHLSMGTPVFVPATAVAALVTLTSVIASSGLMVGLTVVVVMPAP